MIRSNITQVLCGAALSCAIACGSAFAITANPNVSIGKPLYIGGAINPNYIDPLVYTDGKLDANQLDYAYDFALNVGEGPSKLFITWDSRGDEAWAAERYVYAQGCQHNVMVGATLQNFLVLTSPNSTNGLDGDWQIVAQVGESGAASRGLAIDFEGMSWFRIMAQSPVVNLEEVGAYDISNGAEDTWFFMGTSITQMGIKQFAVDSNFAELIHARFPAHYPAMIRGGIACLASHGVVDAIKFYLENAGNVKFWAIEMGTNDAWVGNTITVEQFASNMQTIIDSAKAHGITPIIARIIATNEPVATWQVPQEFLDVIDRLVKINNLPQGPDFYTHFLAHPEEFTIDGVHPNEKGAQSMHRLWAEAVIPLFQNKKFEPILGTGGSDGSVAIHKTRNVQVVVPKVSVDGRAVSISGVNEPVSVIIADLTGHIVWRGRIGGSTGVSKSSQILNTIPAGNYIVKIRGATTSYKSKISIR